MRAVVAVVVLAAALALTGCDHYHAALARPGGESLERVRMATIDVVLEKGYQILEAPVCTPSDGTVTCSGSTVDGQDITATSPRADRDDVTVSVGGTQLYDGAVRTVLEDAARAG